MSVIKFPEAGEKMPHEGDVQKSERVKAILKEMESERGIKVLEAAWDSIQGKSFQEMILELATALDEAGATIEEQEDAIKKYIAFVTALGERHGQRQTGDDSEKAGSS